MSRCPPLVARRVAPLVATLVLVLASCDDDAADTTTGTVAVGSLPSSLPSPPSSGTAPAETSPTSEPVTTVQESTTTTVAPVVLAATLADLVGGGVGEAPPAEIVTDGTGRLRMAVPTAWSDRRTDPAPLPGGAEAPSIAASGDQTAFLDGYDEPGLTAVVVDAAPADALDAYAFDDCTSDGRRPFVADRLQGSYEAWRDCAGTGSSIVTVAVRPAGADGTVLVLAQVAAPADLAAVDGALATLRLRGR